MHAKVLQYNKLQNASGTNTCTAGTPRNAALFLVPGWRFPTEIWKAQIEYFSRSRRVIAIDPRSQGGSTKTDEGNTPESRARDLHEVIRQLGMSHIALVGWSQGVQDVAAYVNQFGMGRIDAIVIVDTAVSPGPDQVTLDPGMSKEILGRMALLSEHPKEYMCGMMPYMFESRRTRN